MIDLFNRFFSQLNASAIPYGITGRSEDYPQTLDSDIDIIIPTNAFQSFWSFMHHLEQDAIDWVQVISHEKTAHYCIISVARKSKHVLLKPDVCSDYYRRGTLFLKADYLLENRVLSPKGFFQLAPAREFIYYLLKKVDKGHITPDQFQHLHLQWKQDPSGCSSACFPFFGPKLQSILRCSFNDNDASLFSDHLSAFRKDLHHKLNRNLTGQLKHLSNRVLRVLQPTGLVVAFMGPDGSGKTTVINGVKETLGEAFRQNKQFHLTSREPTNGVPNANPHSESPRGFAGSLMKLAYLLVHYLTGHWTKIYPLKVKSTLVIFDRYYHDLLIDPRRYRHGASAVWVKIVSFFIPKPDLWILMDASPEIVQSRKSEVSPQETQRQVLAYQRLFSNLKNAYIVNANQSPRDTILDAEKIIMGHLKQRTKYRN